MLHRASRAPQEKSFKTKLPDLLDNRRAGHQMREQRALSPGHCDRSPPKVREQRGPRRPPPGERDALPLPETLTQGRDRRPRILCPGAKSPGSTAPHLPAATDTCATTAPGPGRWGPLRTQGWLLSGLPAQAPQPLSSQPALPPCPGTTGPPKVPPVGRVAVPAPSEAPSRLGARNWVGTRRERAEGGKSGPPAEASVTPRGSPGTEPGPPRAGSGTTHLGEDSDEVLERP